jgi:lipopolysaccharide/colanic/teichoic acid biosynthesis glycosyltransferase
MHLLKLKSTNKKNYFDGRTKSYHDKIDSTQEIKLFDNTKVKNKINKLTSNTTSKSYTETTRLNDIRYINRFFIQVNNSLNIGDYFMIHVEVLEDYRKRKKSRNIPFIGFFVRLWDFSVHRISPKVWGIKKLYFGVTRGKRRLISKAEVLGRLISCGFEIIELLKSNGEHVVISKKISEEHDEGKPSYGPLFKMRRVGKNRKIIGVYKLRTMHPYSEFLQEYMIKTHGYGENGKIKDDFRTSKWAKIIRKYWIDELPQLLNVLKGDMKLVGARPVSETYYENIPKDLQEMRSRFKPGCIPPYVAFNVESSLESVLESERKYLKMKIKNPYTTDTKLFFKAIFNIVFRGKRSA